MTFSLGTTNDAYAELLRTLTEIAKQRGSDNPAECANATRRKILRAIERKRSDKLNDWHYQRSAKKSRDEASELDIGWASYLVRLKSNEKKRLARDDAIEDAKGVTVTDLTPIERRAVELLCGVKRKAKNNFLEKKAEVLASAVKTDWFSSHKSAGRPQGTNSRKAIQITELSYYVPLSTSEVITTVIPLIEEVAGTSSRDDAKLVLPAVIAAVHTVHPHASQESISRLARRFRLASRNCAPLERP
ncbi:MAG TPA: hypothetical protein VH684_04735 [Xanthobacteraceae bacterium]|jgi:hypothetical protein